MQRERSKRLKVVVLQTHPIQYYAPLYSEISKRDVIDLHVIYLSDSGARAYHDANFGREITWDIPLLAGYSHTILQPGAAIQGSSFLTRNDPKLTKVLEQLSPDWILVYGYASWMNWRALYWAARHDVLTAYFSDSNLRDKRTKLKSLVKGLLLRLFFMKVNVCFAISESNAAYVKGFGIKDASVKRVPFAIDVKRFQSGIPDVGQQRAYNFIWAGKLIEIKRPGDFLWALARLASRTQRPVNVAIVGEGELMPSLVAQANSLPKNCHVDFLGFLNQQAMPDILQRADALVFSSEREAYGLIATEAAAAGLALIVAANIGCVGATVLARSGINARTYPAGDIDALADEMHLLFDDAVELHRYQRASRLIAAEHDLAIAAEIIERTLEEGEQSD